MRVSIGWLLFGVLLAATPAYATSLYVALVTDVRDVGGTVSTPNLLSEVSSIGGTAFGAEIRAVLPWRAIRIGAHWRRGSGSETVAFASNAGEGRVAVDLETVEFGAFAEGVARLASWDGREPYLGLGGGWTRVQGDSEVTFLSRFDTTDTIDDTVDVGRLYAVAGFTPFVRTELFVRAGMSIAAVSRVATPELESVAGSAAHLALDHDGPFASIGIALRAR